MMHTCDNCCADTENEPMCLCDECNAGCSSCSDYERRYEDLLDRFSRLMPYIMHKHGCGLEALGVCDCGLSALLKP